MKEPVDHVLRPTLPWREPGEAAVTECGYDATKVKTITRAEFFAREKELGRQRAAMFTCMTCSDTAKRWGTWDEDPRLALQREIEWERGHFRWHSNDRGYRLLDELMAIRALVDSRRGEFHDLVSENKQRREWLEKKAAMARRSKAPRQPRSSL